MTGLPVVLHVGFSKTGTTTLQKHLYAHHPQIAYLGKEYAQPGLKAALTAMLGAESTVWDPEPLRALLKAAVQNAVRPEHRVLVLSDETLVSYSKVRDRGLVARRLLELFPRARILFTIRSQWSLLRVAYLARGRMLAGVPHPHGGRFVSWPAWIDHVEADPERSYLGHSDFARTIRFYLNEVGAGRVGVFPLEGLADDPDGHESRICAFLGVDGTIGAGRLQRGHEKPPMKRWELERERWLSHLPRGWRDPRGGGRGPGILVGPLCHLVWQEAEPRWGLPPHQAKRLEAFWAPGNVWLAETFQLPLPAWGYPGMEGGMKVAHGQEQGEDR